MLSVDHTALLRRARRERLFGALPHSLRWGEEQLHRLLPHRSPFLLLDSLLGTNEDGTRALGERRLDRDDPVFVGHFPRMPVYPGVLLVEMGAQLGLCLGPHLRQRELTMRAREVRLVRIIGAEFVGPAFPGDALTVLAEALSDDGWFTAVMTQIVRGEQVICAAILEALTEDR